jgi:hypothetical protein
MMKVHVGNLGRLVALATVLWGLLCANAGAQTAQVDPLHQQQQRRQELRSMMRQQQPGTAPSTAAAVAATKAAPETLSGEPRRLSAEEKNELRRQLTRDLRVARASKP